MRRSNLGVAAVLSGICGTANASDLAWPNPAISIPPLVDSYIASECRRYASFSEETIAECREGERYGYRAVVGLLMDPETGEKAAELYRDCRVGLGDLGGRFHRRRAECMGAAFELYWRFEFADEAAAEPPAPIIETRNRAIEGSEVVAPIDVLAAK
jgi:hypothetical protein